MDLTKYYPDIVAKYPAYVTQRELCEICRICPKTAYNLEQQGEIPYTIEQNHLIRSHKIKLTDILAYLYRRECRQEADSPYICAKYKDAILYLRGIIEGKIRPERLEAAQIKINALLDQSVITSADARTYTINENGKELDLSKIDTGELRAQFKQLKNKNLEISNLRQFIEEKLQQMLRRNVTRAKFAERFRNIIDEYNAGGSRNDDFYEKLIALMEELRTEEERHIKEDLSEEELELFDLLRKDHLTKEDEKRVKLAARELYATLLKKRQELFVVGWQNDPQPKERVKSEIASVLNTFLPESYDRKIFLDKSNDVFNHILDQALTGYNWVA